MIKSSNLGDAFKAQFLAECGDKTFILIMIFTIAWSNWHLDLEVTKDDEDKQDKDEPQEEIINENESNDEDAFKSHLELTEPE